MGNAPRYCSPRYAGYASASGYNSPIYARYAGTSRCRFRTTSSCSHSHPYDLQYGSYDNCITRPSWSSWASWRTRASWSTYVSWSSLYDAARTYAPNAPTWHATSNSSTWITTAASSTANPGAGHQLAMLMFWLNSFHL